MSDPANQGDSHDRNKAYYLIVDAMAWSNYRFLDYWRGVWEINSRPHASMASEAYLRESAARASEILQLTIDALDAQAAKSAELTERLAEEGAHLQHAALEAYRGLLETSIANIRHVQQTTAAQLEEVTKRLAEMQARASS
ncbi:MAG: hypothetical protein ACLPYS_13730 [Vulcanimicrobiaceae bacterium]